MVRKTSEQMFGCNGQTQNQTAGCYLGLGFAGCQSGCVAKALREAAAAGTDPSLATVDSMYPAMVYDGGYNREDPAHSVGKSWGPQAGGWNAHTWVGSRSSSTDAVFDSNGGDVNGMGYRKTHLWRCAASGPDGGAVRSDNESVPREGKCALSPFASSEASKKRRLHSTAGPPRPSRTACRRPSSAKGCGAITSRWYPCTSRSRAKAARVPCRASPALRTPAAPSVLPTRTRTNARRRRHRHRGRMLQM